MSDETRRAHRRLGWTSLAAWASFGLAIEAAHGLKLAAYLDDELTRLLLTLAHAHGVGLALVVIVFGEAAPTLFAQSSDGGASLALRTGALVVPLAFALSAIAHPEGDPNVLAWLVPPAALLVIYALVRAAIAAWRAPAE